MHRVRIRINSGYRLLNARSRLIERNKLLNAEGGLNGRNRLLNVEGKPSERNRLLNARSRLERRNGPLDMRSSRPRRVEINPLQHISLHPYQRSSSSSILNHVLLLLRPGVHVRSNNLQWRFKLLNTRSNGPQRFGANPFQRIGLRLRLCSLGSLMLRHISLRLGVHIRSSNLLEEPNVGTRGKRRSHRRADAKTGIVVYTQNCR